MSDDERPLPWQLQPGNVITSTWVNWRGRTMYTNGVIRDHADGAVLVTDKASTPMDRAKGIDVTRFRQVDVAKEGSRAKALRIAVARRLDSAAQALEESAISPDDLLALVADVRAVFEI